MKSHRSKRTRKRCSGFAYLSPLHLPSPAEDTVVSIAANGKVIKGVDHHHVHLQINDLLKFNKELRQACFSAWDRATKDLRRVYDKAS